MLDKNLIGKSFPTMEVEVEKGQLVFFARTVGESNPVYTDESAAREAGYHAIPAPPTFIFSLGLARPDPMARYVELGIDIGRILHGEQQFEYFNTVCAGDRIKLESSIVDIFDKKGGALEFMIEKTRATNQDDVLVAELSQTLVIRN